MSNSGICLYLDLLVHTVPCLIYLVRLNCQIIYLKILIGLKVCIQFQQ